MKIAIINHHKKNGQIEEDFSRTDKVQWLVDMLQQDSSIYNPDIYVIQRASNDEQVEENNITTMLVKDSFGSYLRWCDNPEDLNQVIGEINPDIVHMYDLGLPMHFRWLRHKISSGTKLIGHHTGERIWVQLRLFLQQHGLRAADAFIFENLDFAQPWLKASVILPSQPVFEIPNGQTPMKSAVQKLADCYSYILNK